MNVDRPATAAGVHELPAGQNTRQIFFNFLFILFGHISFYLSFWWPRLFNDIVQSQSVQKPNFLHCSSRVPRQSVHFVYGGRSIL
jgi:hypothetical protein